MPQSERMQTYSRYRNVRMKVRPMNVSNSITLTEKAEALIGNSSTWNEYKGTTSERRDNSNEHAKSDYEKLTENSSWNYID